jgi:hypothetical protein
MTRPNAKRQASNRHPVPSQNGKAKFDFSRETTAIQQYLEDAPPDKQRAASMFLRHMRHAIREMTTKELIQWVRMSREVEQEVRDEIEELDSGIVIASKIKTRRRRWLWPGMIPEGKITILDGDPDRGKSVITLELSARVSRGLPYPLSPNKARSRPRGAVIICGEDDWEDTVNPRLSVARADLDRIAHIEMRKDEEGRPLPIEIPRDLGRIKRAIKLVDARLVVIDPIMGYLGKEVNTGNDASVRRAMMPLAEIANETGVAMLLVRHLNKDGDARAIYRGGGSIAFIGVARSGLVAERHPDNPDQYVLAQMKGNLNRGSVSYVYEIAEVEGEPRIRWCATSALTGEELLANLDARKDAPARDACWAAMEDLFDQQEPYPAKEMKEILIAEGYGTKTIFSAKQHHGVMARQVRDESSNRITGWEWFRPDAEPE